MSIDSSEGLDDKMGGEYEDELEVSELDFLVPVSNEDTCGTLDSS